VLELIAVVLCVVGVVIAVALLVVVWKFCEGCGEIERKDWLE